MASMFELLAASLFIATTGMFFLRLRHESPSLAPYLVILLSSVAGAWLGGHGAPAFAVCIFIAGAFLLLHIASLPYSDKREDEPMR